LAVTAALTVAASPMTADANQALGDSFAIQRVTERLLHAQFSVNIGSLPGLRTSRLVFGE
jgi:hypothetical protein